MKIISTPFRKHFWTFWPVELYQKQISDKKKDLAGFCLIVLVAAVANLFFINNELWQDELYTLEHFVLVPIGTTLNDYHSSNNHFVFNFIANVYLKIIGINNLADLLYHPILIRILPYSFTVLSVLSFYLLSKKIFGSLLATIASIIFITSLQTYSFGVQVRGYSLEVLLCTLHFLLILRYKQTTNNNLIWIILIIGILELVNLPSTLYFYAAIILLLVISIASDPTINSASKAAKSDSGKLLVPILGSLLIALFFLIPRLHQIKNNAAHPFRNSLFVLLKHPFAVFFYFVDFRYFILIPPILSCAFLYRKKSDHRLSFFLGGSFFFPFLFFALHNPYLIHRIWIVLLPVFSLLIAQFSIPFFYANKKYLVPFALLNGLTLVISMIFLQESISFDNSANRVRLDLRYQYHLFGFNPSEVLQVAREFAAKGGAKIEIEERSIAGIRFYSNALNMDSINLVNKNSTQVILITDSSFGPNRLEEIIGESTQFGKFNKERFYKWYLLKQPIPQ
jgi:hypothetical protein